MLPRERTLPCICRCRVLRDTPEERKEKKKGGKKKENETWERGKHKVTRTHRKIFRRKELQQLGLVVLPKEVNSLEGAGRDHGLEHAPKGLENRWRVDDTDDADALGVVGLRNANQVGKVRQGGGIELPGSEALEVHDDGHLGDLLAGSPLQLLGHLGEPKFSHIDGGLLYRLNFVVRDGALCICHALRKPKRK